MEIQTIEQLRARFTDLNDKKTRATTLLEKAKEELQSLQTQAKEAFGTDDLEKLEQMLQAMERDNEVKRLDYQQLLDSIDNELKEVDRAFADTR